MISFHIFFIAIIQGITEFLPISSSAHLIILPYLMKVSDQGVIIDISAHFGSLFAIIIYYKKDSLALSKGFVQFFVMKTKEKEFLFFLKILIATIPVVIIGLLFKLYRLDIIFRSVEIIGWTMIIFGILLFLTDKFCEEKNSLETWSWRNAFFVGIFQALALIPGVSRSGITITSLRLFGYNRYDSIKISLLMAIPTILLSGFFITPQILIDNNITIIEILIPFTLSFITALIVLKIMVKYVYIFRFTPYVIYRILLGVVLLYITYY